MIKYGLISDIDARCLEKTIDLVCKEFKDETINVCEIGVYGGDTGKGLSEYIKSNGMNPKMTGIDNKRDGESIRFIYDRMIYRDSGEATNLVEDGSQHLIFVDGCHCFAHVVSDFFCYAPKVKEGGYISFHDTGKHIKPFKDFQHGDERNPDAYISCRKALKKIGLLIADSVNEMWQDKFGRKYQWDTGEGNRCWELIFDEADETIEAGGICVFKKLY